MTLTTRVLLFFVAALAVVLAGFSATLYVLARSHLYAEVDARLEQALSTLAAAADTDAGGVQWDPREPQLALGRGSGREQVRWLVRDNTGNVIDRSANLPSDDFFPRLLPIVVAGQQARRMMYRDGEPWRLVHRRLNPSTAPANASAPDDSHDGERRYPAVLLTAGVNLQPVETTLRVLPVLLGGVSLTVLLLGGLVGRVLVRRALVPVAQMAAAARAIDAADLDRRLPHPATRDELENLGLAFNDLLDRLQESFERQRQFTGNASHQLRTPLAAMLGQIELALRRDRPATEYRRVLALLDEQAGRLRQILEMLLFLARADSEAKLPNLEAVDLASWLPEHLRSWTGHARAADLQLEIRDETPLMIHAQPAMLGQLLDNLLDNACKYSRPGTPIVLSATAAADTVALAVQDCGCGVATGDLPHIFEPFYRSPRSRHSGVAGVGLGLAVAQRIAAAIGATIRVTSTEGAGTTFTVELSRAAGPEPEPIAEDAAKTAAHIVPSFVEPIAPRSF